jgi:hypothetical protein
MLPKPTKIKEIATIKKLRTFAQHPKTGSQYITADSENG